MPEKTDGDEGTAHKKRTAVAPTRRAVAKATLKYIYAAHDTKRRTILSKRK